MLYVQTFSTIYHPLGELRIISTNAWSSATVVRPATAASSLNFSAKVPPTVYCIRLTRLQYNAALFYRFISTESCSCACITPPAYPSTFASSPPHIDPIISSRTACRHRIERYCRSFVLGISFTRLNLHVLVPARSSGILDIGWPCKLSRSIQGRLLGKPYAL